MEHTFKEGDEVILCVGSYGHYTYTTVRIRKVYKTGKFVLEGDSFNQQYTQYGIATGGGWTKNSVKMATQENKANAEAANKRRECINGCAAALDDLYGHARIGFARSKFTAGHLAALEAIVKDVAL